MASPERKVPARLMIFLPDIGHIPWLTGQQMIQNCTILLNHRGLANASYLDEDGADVLKSIAKLLK